MATLILDEGGADFEIDYVSTGEYREGVVHARVKMAQFLFGCAQVVVNIVQFVISFPTVCTGNTKPPKIELKKFIGNIKEFFLNFLSTFKRRRKTNFSV